MGIINNLKNKRFGKLKVKKISKLRDKHRRVKWECKCDCGKICIVTSRELISGHTKSCGCLGNCTKFNYDRKECIIKNKYSLLIIRSKKYSDDEILSYEDFKRLIFKPCFYCGKVRSNHSSDPTTQKLDRKCINSTIWHNGLDRIDSNIGYTKFNTVPCCKICNFAKHTLTVKEFINHLTNVIDYMKNKPNDEDELIARSFIKIKEGILECDWNKICQAYFDIAGEKLDPPDEKTKTRLESIREMMNSSVQSEEKEDSCMVDISTISVSELKKYLIDHGVEKKKLIKKDKDELLNLLPQKSPSEPIIGSIKEETFKGGSKFGLGRVKVINDGFDPIEAAFNQKLAKKRNPPIPRNTRPEDTSNNEDKDSRYYDQPPQPPPWEH